MANYVKATDFQAKDALLTGDPSKIIKGVEINDEFNSIQTAIATKADLASPAFTGNPTAATQASGNSSTRLSTTAFVQGEIASNSANVNITGGTIDGVAITGGTISGLATDLAVADGGTGASSFTANSVVLGNGTSALSGNMVAPGSSGNILTSNGTTWTSAAFPAMMGIATSISFNTSYTATTDGFVIANFDNDFNVNSGFTITVAGNQLVKSTTSSEGANGFVTGMAPVKKGQSYQITQIGSGTRVSAWFVPFGS